MDCVSIGSKKYIPVELGGGVSYGGSQMWARGALRSGGCGAVAAADLVLYLARGKNCGTARLSDALLRTPVPREDYMSYLTSFSRAYVRPIPGLGMTGLRLALCLNGFLKRSRTGLAARWRQLCTLKSPTREIASMLMRDIPVIISLPPSFRRGRGLRMTDAERGKTVRYGGHGGHFVTVTGVEEKDGAQKLEISSWGRRYLVDVDEYLRTARTPQGLLVCGMVTVRDRR